MEIPPLLLALLLGLGLAASCGLNTFLPLLMLSGAAHFHLLGFDPGHLNPAFQWLSSSTAFLALAAATAVEIAGDKVPLVDHLLDAFGMIARPLAGALATAATLNTDPTVAEMLGVILGGPTAFGFHGMKAGTRAISSATTLGLVNPILSLIEDLLSAIVSLISLTVPLLVPVALIGVGGLMWRVFRSVRRKRDRLQSESAPSNSTTSAP
jgi:hypothetical protein